MGDVYIKAVPVALGGDANKPVLMDRPPPSRAEIAAWEAANGRLPEDYIAFMMAYNGGTVYPMAFHHNITEAPDWLDLEPIASVDSFFTWDAFVEANSFNKVDWRVDHVIVAYANERGNILISQRAQDSGAVRYWPANVADWDEEEDGPLPVATVAPTFRDFIYTSLLDDPDGGTPRWSIPRDLATATKVSF
jgi:hypothetical protein